MPARVDPELCEGCGDCVESCPSQIIAMVQEKAVVNEEDCSDCMACVDACHVAAIATVEWVPS